MANAGLAPEEESGMQGGDFLLTPGEEVGTHFGSRAIRNGWERDSDYWTL